MKERFAAFSPTFVLFAWLWLGGCIHHAPKVEPDKANLTIPQECFDSMACKGDIVVRNGRAECKNWAIKYHCTKVQKTGEPK